MQAQWLIDTINEYVDSNDEMSHGNDGDISHIKPLLKIELAQELLSACITLCEEAASEMNDVHAKAYIVDNLKVFLNSQHGFLDSSFNLEKWMDQIKDEDNDVEGADGDS